MILQWETRWPGTPWGRQAGSITRPELVEAKGQRVALPEQRNFLLLICPMRLLARRRGLVQRAPLVSMGLVRRKSASHLRLQSQMKGFWARCLSRGRGEVRGWGVTHLRCSHLDVSSGPLVASLLLPLLWNMSQTGVEVEQPEDWPAPDLAQSWRHDRKKTRNPHAKHAGCPSVPQPWEVGRRCGGHSMSRELSP